MTRNQIIHEYYASLKLPDSFFPTKKKATIYDKLLQDIESCVMYGQREIENVQRGEKMKLETKGIYELIGKRSR